MADEGKIIYRLNDKIAFRKCSLHDGKEETFGDCTNFTEAEEHWKQYFTCNQYGIHFHCAQHPEIELKASWNDYINQTQYSCPRCGQIVYTENNRNDLRNECLAALNRVEFKNAKLVRLDDWYTPEIKVEGKESGYWAKADIKTDKDHDTIVVLYVGHKDENEKAQFFIKPEKGQLTSDHKDMDPAKVLAKVEVTFKNRKLIQEYDDVEV